MPSRTFTVAAAVVSTVVLAAGITYASTDGSTQAEPAPARAEQPVHRAAPPARQAVPAPAPVGSESGTEAKGDKGGNGGGDEGSDRGGSDRGGSDRGGRDDEGGDRGGRDDEGGDRGGRDDEGGGRGGRDRGHDRKRERIFFNEREYGAYPGGCVPAASGLGSSSFSIYNDSRHAVEVFRGFACDGGSPVATVGPYGSTYGVVTPNVRGGGFIDNGVAGSFRVIGHDEEW